MVYFYSDKKLPKKRQNIYFLFPFFPSRLTSFLYLLHLLNSPSTTSLSWSVNCSSGKSISLQKNIISLCFLLASKEALKNSPSALRSLADAKASSYLPCFTGSPVNGAIYSFNVIWSYSKSSFS